MLKKHWTVTAPKGVTVKPGERTIRLDPPPVLKTITFDLADRGLQLLGVQIDSLLSGEEVRAQVPVTKGKEFLQVVLENFDDYQFGEMPLTLFRGVVEVVAADFFFECLMNVKGLELRPDDTVVSTGYRILPMGMTTEEMKRLYHSEQNSPVTLSESMTGPSEE